MLYSHNSRGREIRALSMILLLINICLSYIYIENEYRLERRSIHQCSVIIYPFCIRHKFRVYLWIVAYAYYSVRGEERICAFYIYRECAQFVLIKPEQMSIIRLSTIIPASATAMKYCASFIIDWLISRQIDEMCPIIIRDARARAQTGSDRSNYARPWKTLIIRSRKDISELLVYTNLMNLMKCFN